MLFSEWTNTTIGVGEGSLAWPSLVRPSDAAQVDGPRSSFALLPALLSASEVSATLKAVRGEHVPFDTMADSVDSMATFELYWLSPPHKPVHPIQAPFRKKLALLLQPIVDQRITPLVNARYSAQCLPDGCKPCTSLIRRYHPHERRSHGEHFDLQALACASTLRALHCPPC